jgi:hypothetical protein
MSARLVVEFHGNGESHLGGPNCCCSSFEFEDRILSAHYFHIYVSLRVCLASMNSIMNTQMGCIAYLDRKVVRCGSVTILRYSG